MRTSTIIEDDPVQAELLKALLEQHNISADVVHDFDGACKAIKEGLMSDLVILDYDLGASEGDGVDLCKRIESTTDIPVLVLTGAKNKEIAVEFMNAGARQFVSKPYNVKELLARINKLISRKPTLFDGSHTDADSPPVLDFNLMKASYRGVTIAMSAKQLELFEILLSNEGETVFRDDINFLLNQNAENSRYADTLITKLRRRLAKFPGQIRIRSIRGVGYQLSRSV